MDVVWRRPRLHAGHTVDAHLARARLSGRGQSLCRLGLQAPDGAEGARWLAGLQRFRCLAGQQRLGQRGAELPAVERSRRCCGHLRPGLGERMAHYDHQLYQRHHLLRHSLAPFVGRHRLERYRQLSYGTHLHQERAENAHRLQPHRCRDNRRLQRRNGSRRSCAPDEGGGSQLYGLQLRLSRRRQRARPARTARHAQPCIAETVYKQQRGERRNGKGQRHRRRH